MKNVSVRSTSHVRNLLLTAALSTPICMPGIAVADPTNRCNDQTLRGVYVFTASGFTRAPNSPAGTPWLPKAILQVIEFNGEGAVNTPALTLANPFGDSGDILQPPGGGAPGEYSIDENCTGTVHFFDLNNVTYEIYVDAPQGKTIRMIQVIPPDNVFQGTANRAW